MKFQDPIDDDTFLRIELVVFNRKPYVNFHTDDLNHSGDGMAESTSMLFTGPMLSDLRDEIERLIAMLEAKE